MLPTVLPRITPTDIAVYRASARHHQKHQPESLACRQQRAWDMAHQVATVLKEQFHASHVVLFGALVHAGCFSLCSYLDIAVWGLAPHDRGRAASMVQALAADIGINLVETQNCSADILAVIAQEGVAL